MPALSVTLTVCDALDMRTKAIIRFPGVFGLTNVCDSEGTTLACPLVACTKVIAAVLEELIVMVSVCVAVVEPASVTCATKLHVPAAVGVPDKLPLVLSARPGGKLPDSVQV